MSKMIEYMNPKGHTIQLSSPDKKIIKIPGKAKVILSEWYLNYCPKYLRVVRVVSKNAKSIAPKSISKSMTKYAPGDKSPKIAPNDRRKPRVKPKPTIVSETKMQAQKPSSVGRRKSDRDKKQIVGRRARENAKQLFNKSYQDNEWTISNNIGVGILSYNRLSSLKRLVNSIRRNTDLSKTTIFVSDESTDTNVPKWLKNQKDLVVLTQQKRIGIAGNSNRLLRCLSRFKYGILLNDDTEVLQPGWDSFYRNVSVATDYHHFCYQQIGVYGSKRSGDISNIGGHKIQTIKEKPHGAVMFFTNEIFNRVGYFDENFGFYGMEHVDWSTRASQAGFQPKGFHDVVGSDQFFKIHKENSAVTGRTTELHKAKMIYKNMNMSGRLRVEPTKASEVPSISVVIPLREINRQDAIRVVVNSIRAQKFPSIEIIIAEQDVNSKLKTNLLKPCKYFLAQSKNKNQPFTKAMAFNLGVANATHDDIVLQDGDIICPSGYLQKIHDILRTHEGAHIGSRVLYMTESSTKDIVSTNTIKKNNDCERVVTYYEGGSLACTKHAYFNCGGFNEVFEGYGVEDCDFFERLKHNTKFCNIRTEDLVHMWHGRTQGWQIFHKRNKKISMQLKKQHNISSYVASLTKKLQVMYPEVFKDLSRK